MKQYIKYFWLIPICFIIYVLIMSDNLTFSDGRLTILQYVYIEFGMITKLL